MRYPEICVNERSRPTLAFAWPGASLYTYGVMPVGPVNGLVIFTRMMFNINGEWLVMPIDNGVTIDDDTNTNIIVDDCFNWAILKDQAILYMEAQFTLPRSRGIRQH